MEWPRPLSSISAAHDLRRTLAPQNPRFGYAFSDYPLEDHSTGLIATQTVRFLEHRHQAPFALWVSFPDPHEPWVAPRAYAELFPEEVVELPPWKADEFEAGVAPERIYEDLASGRKDDRPGLAACLKALQPGNTLVIWKLDRLGRDLKHLVNTVDELNQRDVGLKVLAGAGAQIDTTTANGRLVSSIFAALAEFEAELIRERTMAGLAAARARGRLGGRPRKMTKETLTMAMAAMANPESSDWETSGWENIVNALQLTGMTQQLAINCALSNQEADVISLTIAPTHQHLTGKSREDALAKALGQYLGKEVKINISVAEQAEPTPAKLQQARDEVRQDNARSAIEDDSAIQAFKDVFGAQVNPESVQPVD